MVELTINDGNEVLSRLWNNLIASGVVNRRLDSTRIGLILSAIATELNTTLSLIKSYVSQFTLSTCTDRMLTENMARMFAVRRLKSKAKVVLEFSRLDNYNESVRIPAGFAVRASSDPKIIFKTVADVYLWKGLSKVSVLAYSIAAGKENNIEAGVLDTFQNNGFNTSIGVINPKPAYGGYNDESIESFRNRAKGFRYARDGTLLDIRRQLYMLGIQDHRFSYTEFPNGYGSYQICIDVDSESELEDIISSLDYRKIAGIQQVFLRAYRQYLNIYINIDTIGDVDYTPTQKNNLYNTVHTAIQKFFAAYCHVGADLNVNKLKAAINQELNNFEIAAVDISFDNGIVIDKYNKIRLPDTHIFYPAKILTSLNYVGVE